MEYLITDLQVKPEEIMMITFTNKAANEMLSRISKVNEDCYKMWIGTFHRICTRLLRKFGSEMDINSFSIIDEKDSIKIIKKICESMGVETSKTYLKDTKSKISAYKNSLIPPQKVLTDYCSYAKEDVTFASIYKEYSAVCWRDKTFDFDDLILYTIMLVNSNENVKDWIHENIKYIMIDEAQDTSTDQFILLQLLTGDNNIMMVGDIMQSIYGFRNAKPEYLNDFANKTPNTVIMKLEKNYRSTQTIVNAANAVVNNNSFGEKVTMTTDNEVGAPVGIKFVDSRTGNDTKTEASWICSEIKFLTRNGKKYSDFAIIYRTHIQSKDLENLFVSLGIPYSVVGGNSFWSSKELKDVFSFCKIYFNRKDTVALKRALLTINRLGKTTVEKLINYMQENNLDVREMINDISNIPDVRLETKVREELVKIGIMLDKEYTNCSDIAEYVINFTSYADEYRKSQTEEAIVALESLKEIVNALKEFEKEEEDAQSVMDQVSLMSETKGKDKQNLNTVKLMSAHACKGLEFDTVFVCGAEEKMFPHYNSLRTGKDSDIQEERRLFYVAMTRAKKKLYITGCTTRNGETVKPSRFVDEIPKEYIEICY